MFIKLMEDEKATINSKHEAKRFVEQMATFEKKIDLLVQLDDERKMGKTRLADVCSWIESSSDVSTLLVPILQMVINDETSRPLYSAVRNRILMTIFQIPCLFDTLAMYNIASEDESSPRTATAICKFLLALAKSFVEARESIPLREMAKELRKRADIKDVRILCGYLLIEDLEDEKESVNNYLGKTIKDTIFEMFGVKESLQITEAACWVTDKVPPGERHSNDHKNFRDVEIVPTVDELRCEKRPWLPLANQENAIIKDPEIRLMDSNFRLLREDAVANMKATINEQERPWRNARIIGMNFEKGSRSSLLFVIQVDERAKKGKKINWDQSRFFPQNGIIALCRDGIPIKLGTIAMREHKVKGKWLHALGGPQIGVVFNTEIEFNEALTELQHNAPINQEMIGIENLQTDADKTHNHALLRRRQELRDSLSSYDLIEASQSFFSYKPILNAIQRMDCVPFSEQLVHLAPSSERPQYLPRIVRMPKELPFNGIRCDLENWSNDKVINETSLDESQSKALYHALISPVSLIQGKFSTAPHIIISSETFHFLTSLTF